jgi:hypothetical protein
LVVWLLGALAVRTETLAWKFDRFAWRVSGLEPRGHWDGISDRRDNRELPACAVCEVPIDDWKIDPTRCCVCRELTLTFREDAPAEAA